MHLLQRLDGKGPARVRRLAGMGLWILRSKPFPFPDSLEFKASQSVLGKDLGHMDGPDQFLDSGYTASLLPWWGCRTIVGPLDKGNCS